MEDKALRRPGVEWGRSSDGAIFTNSHSHVTAGGQLLDIDAIGPITNKRIFDGFKNSRTTTSNMFVIQQSVWKVEKKEQHIKKT